MVLFLLIGALLINGCTIVSVNAGEEAVLVKKPFVFGHGGIVPEVVTTGRSYVALSTSKYYYSTLPQTVKESFEDLATDGGAPVDFDLYITTQIEKGGSVVIHGSFGKTWYTVNVRPTIRSTVRNEVRKYTLDELRMSPAATIAIQDTVEVLLQNLIKELGLPVLSKNVSLGKAVPPDEVLAETARTAAQKQRSKTQDQRTIAERSRKAAEAAAAEADKEYAKEFHMTTKQFLENKKLDIIASKENVTVIMGGAIPMANIK